MKNQPFYLSKQQTQRDQCNAAKVMSPKITQEGRDATSKGKKVEKSVSTPTLKVPNRFSRSDLIDKHSSGRATLENPRSILKRNRRITVATQILPQSKGSSLSSEKRTKEKISKPRKSVSPDLLDLTNEDVVRDVLLRLYHSLGIDENPQDAEELGSCTSAGSKDQRARLCNINATEKSVVYKPTQGGKVDTTLRRRSMSLPQLRCPNMSCEVFYTPPASSQTVRPLSRPTPRPPALGLSPVMTNLNEGRESFTNLFPTLNSACTPTSSGKISVCSEANAVEIPTIIVQDGVQGRTSRGIFSRKSRADRYSVTFA